MRTTVEHQNMGCRLCSASLEDVASQVAYLLCAKCQRLARAAPDLLSALEKAWAEADWSGVDGDTMEEVANLIALAEEDK